MNIMQQLKERTRGHHDNAEGQEFQRQLAGGELPKPLYVKYLGQLFLIHGFLEKKLLEAQSTTTPEIAKILTPEQLQVSYLEKDLTFFGVDTKNIQPVSATKELIAKIDATAKICPLALLGYHYVLLGSKHGGKFIAHNLNEKYQLNGEGILYFDPYGQSFQPLWKEFASQFNEVPITESQEIAAIDAASVMFEEIANLSEETLKLAAVHQ